MDKLQPDEKGFRYILMWIRELQKDKSLPIQSYLLEWEEFIVDAEKRIAELEAQTVKQEQEPVYLFRRKGLDDFCTCTEERYLELSSNNKFEVKTLFTRSPADAQQQEIERLESQLAEYKVGGAYAERLITHATEVLRISDRKHDAWDALKAAIAKVKP